MWNLETGEVPRTLKGHSEVVSSVAVTGDGKRAVSASYDGTLKVWNLETGDSRTLQGHSDVVHGVAITADQNRAPSASGAKTLRVWDLETGESRSLEGHSECVNGAAVTSNGRHAASVSEDNTLKIWDLETSKAIATYHFDVAPVCCEFTGERCIIAGDRAGRLYRLLLETRLRQ